MSADDDTQAATRVVLSPLLLRAPEAAAVCGCSERHWRRLCSTGRCPESVDLGGVRVWSVRVLSEWRDAGCPSRCSVNGNVAKVGRVPLDCSDHP